MDAVITKPLASIEALTDVLQRWLPVVAEAPSGEATPAAPRPLDVPCVVALLRELTPLLAQNKFGALVSFLALQEAVAGTEAAAEVEDIAWYMAEFKFDVVLSRLQKLAAAHGWE